MVLTMLTNDKDHHNDNDNDTNNDKDRKSYWRIARRQWF